MKLFKRIKWDNVLLALAFIMSVALGAIAQNGIKQESVLTERVDNLQESEAQLLQKLEEIEQINKDLESDNFKLRLYLSNAMDDIEELKQK